MVYLWGLLVEEEADNLDLSCGVEQSLLPDLSTFLLSLPLPLSASSPYGHPCVFYFPQQLALALFLPLEARVFFWPLLLTA